MEEPGKGKKILLVDSDTSYTVPLRNALSRAGYEMICWDDGQKVLESAKDLDVDMVISEVELPNFHGHQLYNEIRSTPAGRSIPFMFLSSQKKVDDRIKSMELGVDDYVTKPFYVEEIVARVNALFQEIALLSEEQTHSDKGFSGSLTEMNLVDLVQTLELGKKSAIIKLKHDATIGMVYVMNGEVIDATLDKLPPQQALMRMVTWNIGNFYVEMSPVNRERTIKLSNNEFITEAMRRINQWEQMASGLPPLNTAIIKVDLNGYENLTGEEKELLEGINEKKKIYEVIENSQFDDLNSLAILQSLYKKGYIQETEDSYLSYTDNYLARLKKNASRSKSTRERLASLISNVLKNAGNGHQLSEKPKIERRQLPDRRRYGRRRDDRLRESNQIHLTKTDLLMIRERLS